MDGELFYPGNGVGKGLATSNNEVARNNSSNSSRVTAVATVVASNSSSCWNYALEAMINKLLL